MNFYNDNDPYVAQWLGNLIAAGHLPQGTVDARSILKVQPDELRPFRQCHFFAGIAGWANALQLAQWPDDREVWTASCPCQPLSSAGQRKGHADERHLWPAFYRLVTECRPATIFGEQVASKDGREWLAGIRADLEHLGYAVGAADLPAASVGAPHIRQRLFWVANSEAVGQRPSRRNDRFRTEGRCEAGGLAQSAGARRDGARQHDGRSPLFPARSIECGAASGLADAGHKAGTAEHGQQPQSVQIHNGFVGGGLGNADAARSQGRSEHAGEHAGQHAARETGKPFWADAAGQQMGRARQPWQDSAWLPCLDGKARRVEPSIQPLAHAGKWGTGSRVGILRGAGNAIIPPLAAEFIAAVMEVL